MIISLSQINTTVGDIEGNLALALAALERARAAGVALLILPEQTFPGYPAKDLLLAKSFVARNVEALHRFAAATANGPAALIGFAEPHSNPGHGLHNAAAFCRGGHIEAIYRKKLLPTYDVFDEDRYFDEGSTPLVIDIEGLRIGVTICEDVWNNDLYWSHRLYATDPVADTVAAGAQVIVNLSASPFTLGKDRARQAMNAATAQRHRVPFLQTNLVAGNDDLVFDGGSAAYAADGSLVGRAPCFDTGELLVDVRSDKSVTLISGAEREPLAEIEQLRRALILGVRDYMGKCGFRQALIGLSGGIDSALVAAIAAEAIGPANVHGVSMPSRYSSDHSKSDAELLANALGIRYSTIAIEEMFRTVEREVGPHFTGAGGSKLAYENVQSRLRGLTLMTLSNATGALVLTTGNKSEIAVGYCTLYGDMCGGLAAIADVPKTRVYELSRHVNAIAGREIIPEGTLTKPPSAELAPDQKDSDSLPPYEVLDPILEAHVERSLGEEEIIALGFDPATVRRVLTLVARNEYKRRQAAPSLKVTGRAFGYGWRMPIARKG